VVRGKARAVGIILLAGIIYVAGLMALFMLWFLGLISVGRLLRFFFDFLRTFFGL